MRRKEIIMKLIVLNKRQLMYCFLLLLMLAAFLSIQYDYASVLVSQAEAKKNMPVCSVQCSEPQVALTFDVARGKTEAVNMLLQILEQNQAKATFFVTGDWAKKHPEVVARMSGDGHDVMNYGNTHEKMTGLSLQEVQLNMQSAAAVIQEYTGKYPALFRAPYGVYNDTILQAARQMGIVGIQWDIDTLDYKNLSAARMVKRVEKDVSSGSIIALSSVGKNTPEALPQIIQAVRDKGLKIAKLSDMVYTNDFWISAHGRQYPKEIPSHSLD
jgi:peptidoglycan/xylan/chitin deacetylase (PgdA/CDA1 family)